MKKVNLYLILFVILSIFNTTITNKLIIWFGLFALVILMYLFRIIDSVKFLILSMLIPSKVIQFLSLVIYLIFNYKNIMNISKKSKINIIFIYYILVSGLVNCLFFKANPLNLFLQSGIYLLYILVIIQFENLKFNFKNFKDFIIVTLYLEFLIGIAQLIFFKATGDVIKGSFISANYFGVYILLVLFIMYKEFNNLKIFIKKYFKVSLFSILFLYLSDVKHLYMSFILAVISYWLLEKVLPRNMKKNIIIIFGILLLLLFFLGVEFLKIGFIKSSLYNISPDNAQYIYRVDFNQKYRYFDRTINSFKGSRVLIGTGVGQYGSQIANFRANDTIYKEDSDKRNIFNAYTNPIYKMNIEDLLTRKYVENIKNISMVMSFPIVSFIPFIFELGIIGYILILVVFKSLCSSNKDAILIIFFLFMTFFDIYFEIPSVFITIMLATKVKNNRF